ncbi:MAG TPA: hypothetical protein VH591_21085 [Ktedonobacterales bacterium]
MATTLLSACGVSSVGTPIATKVRDTATATPLPLPTSLIVLRYSPEDNRVAPFQQTSQDATKIQQLYHALNALPFKVSGISCPQYAQGLGYELSFMDGNTLVLQVMLQTCYGVSISTSSDCRQWTPDLTAQIAETLGVPASMLGPAEKLLNTAGPNGPFAQPAPTPPILKTCF